MSDVVFQTSDLSTATTLSHLGCELVGVSTVGGGNALFRFDRNEKLESILRYYPRQMCRVEPSSFVAEYKRLKSIATNTLEPGRMKRS